MESKFNKKNLEQIRADINKALESVAKKYVAFIAAKKTK